MHTLQSTSDVTLKLQLRDVALARKGEAADTLVITTHAESLTFSAFLPGERDRILALITGTNVAVPLPPVSGHSTPQGASGLSAATAMSHQAGGTPGQAGPNTPGAVSAFGAQTPTGAVGSLPLEGVGRVGSAYAPRSSPPPRRISLNGGMSSLGITAAINAALHRNTDNGSSAGGAATDSPLTPNSRGSYSPPPKPPCHGSTNSISSAPSCNASLAGRPLAGPSTSAAGAIYASAPFTPPQAGTNGSPAGISASTTPRSNAGGNGATPRGMVTAVPLISTPCHLYNKIRNKEGQLNLYAQRVEFVCNVDATASRIIPLEAINNVAQRSGWMGASWLSLSVEGEKAPMVFGGISDALMASLKQNISELCFSNS